MNPGKMIFAVLELHTSKLFYQIWHNATWGGKVFFMRLKSPHLQGGGDGRFLKQVADIK